MRTFALLLLLAPALASAQTAIRPDQISPKTPDITWAPGGTGYQIGTTIFWRASNSTAPTFSTTDLATNIELTAATAISASVPDATGTTGSYPDGFWFIIQTKTSALTLSRTTTGSAINGLGTIKVGPYQTVTLFSRSNKWYAVLKFPQPATQTGANKLKDDMTWAP